MGLVLHGVFSTAQPQVCAVLVLQGFFFFKPRSRRLGGFLLCFRVFFFLSLTRRRPPLGQYLVGTLNHKNCNVYLPKAFETLIHEHVTHIVFFVVCKIYFLLVLLKSSIRSKTMCQNM